jgi:BirA family transcriptional regulator, biotin operon repressor / biotin---[acetyl-CoA-carboxylase] ligase
MTHLHWGAQALWEALEPLLPGIGVEVLARVESTNTRLLERARAVGGDPDTPVTRPGDLDALARQAPARAGAATPHGRRHGDVQPCLLVGEQQTRGRGRLGRGWLSEAGASLTFSLALPLAPAQWGGLSLAVGLALADALDPAAAPAPGTPPRIGLKWPNDLWLLDDGSAAVGRKLGGILIETISVGASRMCVVGIGLNVLPQTAMPEGSAAALTHGYACLQEIDAAASAPAALHRVAPALVRSLKRFEREGFAPQVAGYARRDVLRGRAVVLSGNEPLAGTAAGVDEQGALLLQRGGGALQRVLSGEVSVRLAPTA